MSAQRNAMWKVFSVLFLASVLAPSAVAYGQSPAVYKRLKGQIVVSSKDIPTDFESDKAMIAGLKKAHEKTIAGDGSGWRFNFLAFLSKKPGAASVSVVFYDVSGGKRKSITYKDIHIDPGSTIVASDIEMTKDDGLKAGRYEVVISRIAHRKETVFAKTRLVLK